MVFLLRRIRYSRRGPPGVCWRGREWGGIGLSVTISRVTTTRGGGCPCCAVRTHARRHGGRGRAWGLDSGVRAGCSGARVRGPANMSARVSVFAAARAPRGRPVSLVCSCSRRPGAGHRRHRGRTRSPDVRCGGSSPMPVGRCRFRRRCRRRGLRSRSGLTARRSRSRNLIHTDPVRPVQPSVQYF